MKPVKVMLAVFTILSLVVIGSASSLAQEPKPDESNNASYSESSPDNSGDAPQSSGYGPSDSESANTASGAYGGSLEYCRLRAHHIHESEHKDGRMNGEVRGTCRPAVRWMWHYAQLWEWRFWGWDRIGRRGIYNHGPTTVGSAYGNDICRDGHIRLEGYGWIQSNNGQIYFAHHPVWRYATNPCGL